LGGGPGTYPEQTLKTLSLITTQNEDFADVKHALKPENAGTHRL